MRGPIGAAILTLHRIGWKMTSPFTLEDDWGEEVALTKVTPALLATMLRDATFRTLEKYVGKKTAETDDAFVGRRACTEHLRRQLASDRKLTAAGKAAFMSVLCNAVMTYSKAVQGGYLVQDRCPLCGKFGDTLHHRIWECEHPQVVAARRTAAPPWIMQEIARRPRNQALWVSGLIPHPGDDWPRPASEAIPTVEFQGPGEPPMHEDGRPRILGDIYVDGSCTSHVISELRRAATSLVVLGESQEEKWRVRMAVPTPMPQTPQAAEFVAVPLVHAYAKGVDERFNVASDCLNVVRSCNEEAAKAMGHTRAYGGIMKPALADPDWRKRITVRKVPAHVAPETLPEGQEKRDAIGNQYADEAAKSAIQLHPQASPAMQQDLEAALKRARIVVRTIAAVMPLFPPMPADQRMKRRPLAREGAEIIGDGGHKWAFSAGSWRCEVCWRMTLKPDIDAALAHGKCDGPKESLEAARIAGRGHKLAHVGGQMPVLFCMTCGSYSARRAYGLGATCRGTPTKAGMQALSRIRRGFQPWRTRRDGGGQRPRLGEGRAWSSHRRCFVDGSARESKRRRIDDHGNEDGMDEDDPMSQSREEGPETRRLWQATHEAWASQDIFGHGGDLDQNHEAQADEVGRNAYVEPTVEMHERDEDYDGNHIYIAEAIGTAQSTVGAREGPGGTQVGDATDAAAPTAMEGAAASVVAAWGAVQLQTQDLTARPPSGSVAPLDGDRDTVINKRRRKNSSPQQAPLSLGVGPSANWHALSDEEGQSQPGVVRRRDGTDEPTALATVARSGGAATVQRRWEQPQGGWDDHRDSDARNSECSGTLMGHRVVGGGTEADHQPPSTAEESRRGDSLEPRLPETPQRCRERGRLHRGPLMPDLQHVHQESHRPECGEPRNRDAGQRHGVSRGLRGHQHGTACEGRESCASVDANGSDDSIQVARDCSDSGLDLNRSRGDAVGGNNRAANPVRAAAAELGRPREAGGAAALPGWSGGHREVQQRAARGQTQDRHGSAAHTARHIWMEPPAWMYLPHLGCGTGDIHQRDQQADDDQTEEQRLHASGGASSSGAAAAAIRGRGQAPGSDGRSDEPLGAGAIRGRRTAPGANRARRSTSTAAATSRLRDEAMARYFADIAERAAKRRQSEAVDSAPSPRQRIEALRRRITARAGTGGDSRCTDGSGSGDNAAAPSGQRPPRLHGASAAAAAAVAWHADSPANAAPAGSHVSGT